MVRSVVGQVLQQVEQLYLWTWWKDVAYFTHLFSDSNKLLMLAIFLFLPIIQMIKWLPLNELNTLLPHQGFVDCC